VSADRFRPPRITERGSTRMTLDHETRIDADYADHDTQTYADYSRITRRGLCFGHETRIDADWSLITRRGHLINRLHPPGGVRRPG
jgi:hypothetical protein